MTIQDKILKRIKEETQLYGSLNILSEKLKIHPSYLIRIRNGKQKLSLLMIQKLSKYFNIK